MRAQLDRMVDARVDKLLQVAPHLMAPEPILAFTAYLNDLWRRRPPPPWPVDRASPWVIP